MAKTIKMGAPKSIEGTMTGQETLTVQDMGRCENLKLHDAETIENGGAMKTAMGLMAQYVDDVEDGVTEALKVDVVGDGEVTSDELDGVYECIKNELLSAASKMEGEVTADSAYDDAIALIHERFPDLDVTALVEYVRFKDPLVLSTLLTAYGKTGGLTKEDVDSATTIPSFGGKAITSFDELEKFRCVTSIGSNAFSGCSSLTSLSMQDSVTSIGSNAFSGCSKMELTKLPSALTSIGPSAFRNCYKIAITEIPAGVTSLGDNAFSGCAGIPSMNILGRVTIIPVNAFNGCRGMTSLSMQDSVTSIGSEAFSGCSSLTSLSMQDSVTSIGSNAFSGCSKMELTKLPSALTSIGQWAFNSCYKIAITEIPAGVTSLGDYAFYRCTSIQYLHIRPETPPTVETNSFGGTTFKLYVGDGSSAEHDQEILDAYLEASKWSSYSSRLDTWYNALQEHPEYAE